jgi:hypothetical protein
MLLKSRNEPPIVGELESEIEEEGKRPSLLRQVLPLVPKILFYGFFSLVLLYIVIALAILSSKVQRDPVYAELADGTTTRMVEKETGYRSKKVIHEHILGIVPMLFRISNKLPEEMGGGKDEGVIPAGMKEKVPRAIYVASFNLTEDGQIPILQAIATQFPPEMWGGAQKLLRIYHLDDPVKTDDGYMVYMVASFYLADKNGKPQDAITFNREIHLVPVEKPRFILRPDPLQLLVNGLQKDGLMISYITARKGE